MTVPRIASTPTDSAPILHPLVLSSDPRAEGRSSGPLLEVRDLTVTYRSGRDPVYAARGVDFTLDVGETLGMAGESGSGKTTVAMSLLRLLPAESTVTGEIRFNGEDLLQANWGRMRAVRWAGASMVFQGAMSALNPVKTIGEQIVEPILLHEKVGEKIARARARDLLDNVGVPSLRVTSYPHELSGGQRQRVMMAMALACDPHLVIADEPTTALDVIVQAQILSLLTELVRERGISLIMISHDLSVLASTCDRIAVMYAGRLVETGPSREVIGAPLHPYSRALAGAFPTLGDPTSRLAPEGLAGDPPDLREQIDGCPFAPRCPEVEDRCLSGVIPLVAPRNGAGNGVEGAGERAAACVHVPGYEQGYDEVVRDV
jgi:peptide/nickel transport system ATP-binding protein